MKRIIIFYIMIIIVNNYIFSNNTDEDFLKMNIDEFINDDNSSDKKKIKKSELEKYILLTLSVTNRHVFNYCIINDSTINNNNRFDVNTYNYTLHVDSIGILELGPYFKIYIDNSFRFIHDGNELYNLIDLNHENSYNNYLDNLIRELYFLIHIPSLFPVKIRAGRSFINHGNSYLFNIYNDMAYEKNKVSSLFDYDEVGVNSFDISVFFPSLNFMVAYSPGYPESNDTTEYFNIKEEHSFFGVINFSVPYVNFGFNVFIDTSVAWSIGFTIAVNTTDSLIIYSDFKIKGNEILKRLIKDDDTLFKDMHKYEWQEITRTGFEGVLIGINITPGSHFNIITELYFNSCGLYPEEQKVFFENLDEINNNNKNPQSISIPDGIPVNVLEELKIIKKNQEKDISNYYKGILGESMIEYNIFDLGMFFLFFQISKDNIASTGLDLSFGFFIYLLDGSTMIIPKIRYNFLKYFSIELNANVYLGYKGSMFGEMPYIADIKFLLELKI